MQEGINQIWKYILGLLSLLLVSLSRRESKIAKIFKYFRYSNNQKYLESGWIYASRSRLFNLMSKILYSFSLYKYKNRHLKNCIFIELRK